MNYSIKLTALFSLLLLFLGCSKDDSIDAELNQSEVVLHYDQGFVFNLQGASNVQWSSSDEFVGTIGENGNFSAKHIGETTITANQNGRTFNATVTVEPYITEIVEPFIGFDEGQAAVKAYEERILRDDTPLQLIYHGQRPRVKNVYYSFDINDRLYSSMLVFDDYPGSEADFITFLRERYNFDMITDSSIHFTSRDKELVVAISEIETIGLTAIYFRPSRSNPQLRVPNVYGSPMKSEKVKAIGEKL